jgi:molybdopterin/thiamine biosynthesis adenylyltransferase
MLSSDTWRPVLLDLTRDDDLRTHAELLRSGAIRFTHDTIDEQLRELMALRDPVRTWPREELDARVRSHLGGRALHTYGTWVYFAWSARLVHVLPRDELREVRTDRNRYKITRAEQTRLGGCKIGVIGLSVGNMAAITFALEGIGGSFKIADFDQLSLSNLNRLRGGVHEIGVEKTVLAAREMFEIDPYLEIERYPAGVQPDSIDDFLVGGGKLDLLVEECDDLYVKVVVRERARAHGVPVIMDTSDRGLLDVERFDLEPDRPLFHGLLGDVRAEELRGLETKEKVPFFLAIVDENRMSTRMAASLPEIKQTISTWPQLASGVALGGAITADIGRRILLDTHRESGRYYVDPSDIVAHGRALLREPVAPPPPFEVTEEARRERSLPPQPSAEQVTALDRAAVRYLAAAATLAPSAHNAQPWLLHWRGADSTLECHHDPARDLPSLDFDHGATWVAFGALAENVELTARHLGLEVTTRVFPDPALPRLVATIGLAPGTAESSPLLAHIPARVTNRRRDGRAALATEAAQAMIAACASAGGGARLELRDDPHALDELAALMGAADQLSLLNRDIHHDAMHGYRWTPDEVRAHPHGLDIASMELTASERAGMRLMQQWRTMDCLGYLGGGSALAELAQKSIASASAVGLVSVTGTSRESYFAGGRAVQRTWLAATGQSVALHPMTGLPYLFARLLRGDGRGFTTREQARLRELHERWRALFDVRPDRAEVLLFRLHEAEPPTARSLRRPLDEVLTFS